MKKKGFTLIELLVVIAIIAILLAVLMPSLKRAKKAAKRIHCLNNVKTLSLGMILYTNDYEEKFPPAYTYDNPKGWLGIVQGHRFDPWKASKQTQLDAIMAGVLYPYVENTKVYRCPVAEKNEFRTYSIPHSMGGSASDGAEIVRKRSQVIGTDRRIMFLDDYIYDWDACWMIYYRQPKWWNSTPIRHGSGGNVFSFLDGHSEFHIWQDKRTVELGEKCFELQTPEARPYHGPQPDNEDIIWSQKAVWGELGYTP